MSLNGGPPNGSWVAPNKRSWLVFPNSDEISRLQVFISLTSGPRQVRRFFDSEIDLIQNYFSNEEDDTPSVNVRTVRQTPKWLRNAHRARKRPRKRQLHEKRQRKFELKWKKSTSIRMQFLAISNQSTPKNSNSNGTSRALQLRC